MCTRNFKLWHICGGTSHQCFRGSTSLAKYCQLNPSADKERHCGSPRAAWDDRQSVRYIKATQLHTVRASTNSWHGTTFMLSRRLMRSNFSRISDVSPLTRRVKKLLAQPLPKANIEIRLPLSCCGSMVDKRDERPPYSEAVYMLPQRAAQRIEGATRSA